MFTIKVIHEVQGLGFPSVEIGEKLDRLTMLLEGQMQAQIDQIAQQLNASTDEEEAAIKQAKGE